MECRSRIVGRVLLWAFAVCVAAAVWTAGFYGGRSSGREQGYADGLVPTPEGIEAGRVDAVQEVIDRASRRAPSEDAYDVRALVAERLGKKPTELTNLEQVNEEMVEIADEIYRQVAPQAEFGDADSEFLLRGFPTEQMFTVKTDGRRHAELTVYLKSKEDYLVWKSSQVVTLDEGRNRP